MSELNTKIRILSRQVRLV